ncbi:uncharacterized protein Z518_00591 [Rhinocladiella mackenziei CBS 650.93]|uniref:Palmitoyltransferase n=1 Tax=Rhinocladiella mackenziei CBS 650.93 TaxID=1442369 RepID=A0A0D2J1I1_9EURO|nr:uncharacterized protein Z518_00591 [Rhinocladiella mackenziei CBS 650.93]KIX09511.1 hypothetical protein Z518_00591 [Rhinocladiella mackenziei CBS 650.93]
MRPGQSNKRGHIITARIVPVFLLGIIVYSSWVVTKSVCIDYLINPRPSIFVRPQTGAAIAILTIYYLLLLIALICFGRLLQTIAINPGLVPRGSQWYIEKERKRRKSMNPNNKEDALEYDSTEGYTPRHLRQIPDDEGFRAQDFWHKDVFVCGWDGRPPFCSTCYNYKPDRAHHCSELGRCVLKMDHFCPWVGGIVSETSFKYFIQFTFWAAWFCLNTLVFMAYYFAKRQREENFVNVHWILVLIFASLFLMFTAGMCGSSLQFAFLNSTTIENFTRKTKVWYLAVYIPNRVLERYQSSGRSDLRLITYPRPPSEQFQILQQYGAKLNDSQQSVARGVWDVNNPPALQTTCDPQSLPPFPPHPTIAQGDAPPSSLSQPDDTVPPSLTHAPTVQETRTFAILETVPGANPFDIGPFNNFKEVMGCTVFDWFIPLHASPLADHRDPRSMYKLGPLVEKMRRTAGIQGDVDVDGHVVGGSEVETQKKGARTRRHRRRRRRRRRRTSTTTTTSHNRGSSRGKSGDR